MFFDEDLSELELIEVDEPFDAIEVNEEGIDCEIFGIPGKLLVDKFMVEFDSFLLVADGVCGVVVI